MLAQDLMSVFHDGEIWHSPPPSGDRKLTPFHTVSAARSRTEPSSEPLHLGMLVRRRWPHNLGNSVEAALM